MSVLKVKNGNQWDIVPAIKGDPGDPAADESITDDMLVTDGIKTEIEWLWGNQLMDSREGEILHAEDAYTAPAVDISVDGKSAQVTTTGKNLLDESNNIVRGYFYDSNDKIEGGGTSIYAPVTEGATYTMSGGNGNRYVVAYTDVLPAVNAPLIAHASAQKTFTVPTGARYVVFYIDNGSTLTPSGYQLEAGSSATAYEPYTGGKASPNPDYPQEIVSVVNPVLTVAGKNLIASTANGYIYDTGGVYGSTDYYKHTNYIRVAPGQKYVVSQGGTNFTTGIRTAYYNGKKHLINALPMSGVAAFVSTAPANAVYMRTSCQGIYVSEFVVRVGADSVVQPYEPYLGTTVPLLPDGYSLRSLPDGTKDELHLSYLRPSKRAGWAWYSREVTRNLYEQNVSGFGQYYKNTEGHTRVRANVGSAAKAGESHSRCNRFIYNSSTYNYGVPGDYYISNQYAYFILPDEIADIDAAKAWLAEHPVTLLRIATPTTETLDPIELPIMPSQTVNVWSDPATNLKMTYIQDSNLIIENLEATIADIATS